jgi:hypothetical protein
VNAGAAGPHPKVAPTRAVLAGLTAATLLAFAWSALLLWAFGAPAPRDLRIGVAAPAAVVQRLDAQLAQRAPGAFDVVRYAAPADLRAAVERRDVAGGLALTPQGPGQVLVAGGNGAVSAQAVRATLAGALAAQGRPAEVVDLAPLARGASGAAPFFVSMAALLAALLGGAAVALLGGRLGLGRQLAALIALAGAVAATVAWVATKLTDALPDRFWALLGLAALFVGAIALCVAGLVRLAGAAGIGLAAALFIVVGLPASGTVFGPSFIPPGLAAVGWTLPLTHAVEAVRSAAYFPDASLLANVAALGGWALAGLALLLGVHIARARRERPGARAAGAARPRVGAATA